MKFFTVAAFFAAAVMASPTAPIPGAAAGNGNAPEITQTQTKVNINQTQQNNWNTVCSAKGHHPVCCDKVDGSKTSTNNLGLLSGLLGNGLGDILGLDNLVGGKPEACSGLVSALNKQCQTNIGCCQQNSDSSNQQSGLLNLNLQAPCLLSNGL
ncbi:hypothetical protein BDV40DRAFT_264212 [Aspergillus tamarii]|uniref:Hydrophobin n=1 Tax=Aspergillus tamarii TaxID=41984 RepID=A0A5N6UW44_ASPTM|nr:hypothetical protein BDV40DRAFT_264212 [Aspergillus tamarii]